MAVLRWCLASSAIIWFLANCETMGHWEDWRGGFLTNRSPGFVHDASHAPPTNPLMAHALDLFLIRPAAWWPKWPSPQRLTTGSGRHPNCMSCISPFLAFAKSCINQHPIISCRSLVFSTCLSTPARRQVRNGGVEYSCAGWIDRLLALKKYCSRTANALYPHGCGSRANSSSSCHHSRQHPVHA